MNNEVKTFEPTPASFIQKDSQLTIGQKYLMDLLIERIGNRAPITQEDIVDVYFKSVNTENGKIRVRGNFGSNHFFCNYHDKNSSVAKNRANTWFKQNIGTCIIKGKLLVIPVIEIEQKKIL